MVTSRLELGDVTSPVSLVGISSSSQYAPLVHSPPVALPPCLNLPRAAVALPLLPLPISAPATAPALSQPPPDLAPPRPPTPHTTPRHRCSPGPASASRHEAVVAVDAGNSSGPGVHTPEDDESATGSRELMGQRDGLSAQCGVGEQGEGQPSARASRS